MIIYIYTYSYNVICIHTYETCPAQVSPPMPSAAGEGGREHIIY